MGRKVVMVGREAWLVGGGSLVTTAASLEVERICDDSSETSSETSVTDGNQADGLILELKHIGEIPHFIRGG